MRSTALTRLKSLLQRPSFTSNDARAKGVHPSLLSYYAKQGYIEKLSRGVYRGIEQDRKPVPFEWEDLAAVIQSIPKGIVCLITALSLYELTDENPRQFWIAVPHETLAPRRPQVKIVRMRNTKIGSSTFMLGEAKIKIFDRERTIVDAFRYLSKEIAIKALKRYLSGKNTKPDLQKLMAYSKLLRTSLRKYVEAITT